MAVNANELNRFGWCTEVDPFDPTSTPVKRTARGRVKHEGATVTEVNGRVVVYSGDDQDGEYVYKYVSSQPWKKLRGQGKNPLDHGTLYVGKFNDDGTGGWLPLVFGTGPFTAANGWADQADVLLRPDRGYDHIKNNQMLAADPATKEIKRFLVGPRGCEITGVITTPDQRTMFVNVQHPGEETTFWGTPTPENPRVVSNWPDFDPNGRARSATW